MGQIPRSIERISSLNKNERIFGTKSAITRLM